MIMERRLNINQLERRLGNTELSVRISVLKQLKNKADKGRIIIEPKNRFMNLHCHTLCSYNAYGYSPAHIAWIGYKNGYDMMGIVDFDVLDGMKEFLQAGEILGLKTVVGMETRVFIEEYKDKVINSPHEPGIIYFMGTGFYEKPERGSPADTVLKKISNIAKQRNLSVLKKLNSYLQPVDLNYEKDIVPLTLSGNATERHILKAYYRKSKKVCDSVEHRIAFWAEKLELSKEKIVDLFCDEYRLYELMRGKLIKHGGIGYIEPDPENFPKLDEVIEMIKQTDALPCYPFLDGMNEGEEDIGGILEFFKNKGINVINIIPDRNWNIEDEGEKQVKVEKFNTFMEKCRELDLYVIPGTEMNKMGQKLVDDFDAPELKPYLDDFIKGANYVYDNMKK